MAILTQPHWEQVSPLLQNVMVQVGHQSFAKRFYLAGGTALALQVGHRVSVDLDFFSASDELLDESRREIVAALRPHLPFQIVHDVAGSLLLNVQGTAVGFFSYGYPLLAETIMIEGIALAGLLDIGLMKLDAIASRGVRKDFCDLYFIAQHLPLNELLEHGQEKYPHTRDFGMMVLDSLVDFSVAEQQAAIETSPPIAWEDIKKFYIEAVQHIGRNWFEGEN
ncbi:MAG: nucleotidyl transferase AbiEii/AbiGii toxin family protein [Anaerolineae bacterium]